MTEMFSDADVARCRSAVYSAFAYALSAPAAEIDESVSGRCTARLVELLEACGATELAPVARGLASKAPSALRYGEIFGHTAHGQVSPYETHYGEDSLFHQPRELADIGGFLSAFGLVVNPHSHERVDHVSSECELMAFLSAKEAYASDAQDDVTLDATRKAQQWFLRDHVGRFGPAFGERLRRTDSDGFYGCMGALLRGFLEAECARLSVEAGSPALELRRPAEDEAAPMACGSCPINTGG